MKISCTSFFSIRLPTPCVYLMVWTGVFAFPEYVTMVLQPLIANAAAMTATLPRLNSRLFVFPGTIQRLHCFS
ncbi:hypothetical protein [Variovorax jilinensis]|uniref:hypothetical protein n=1 Tax=Variovorax jilinensis TaxID=3053513 RepID=UPI0025785257|nr:hypothetical protein [Variovorax sp. J22P168]